MGSSLSSCVDGKHEEKQQDSQQPWSNGLPEAAPKQQQEEEKETERDQQEEAVQLLRVPSVKSGTPGARLSLPPQDVRLAAIDASLLSALSGPDGGVQVIRSCAPDLKLPWPWNKSHNWAYGSSISLYDATITAGKPTRSGDPIADCFAILSFKGGALLTVADGVNWGEPARRAARCAVLGATHHLCSMLQENHGKEPGPTSSSVFREMLAAVHAAHTLILQQCGTLTTLVLTLVLKVQDRSPEQEPRWAALTLTVGDSLAYVYRPKQDTVQELTYASHKDCVRNVASPAGSLGQTGGSEPDLGNMTASTTWLHEGDIVFLASDGVTDNFDPSILKLAKPPVPPKETVMLEGDGNSQSNSSLANASASEPNPALPTLSPAEMHAKAMELLLQGIREVAALPMECVVSAQLPDRFVVSLESLEALPPAHEEDTDHLLVGTRVSSASHVTANFGSTNHHSLATGSWTTKHSAANAAKLPASSPPGPMVVRDLPSTSSTTAQASGVTIGERFLTLSPPSTQPPSATLGLPLTPPSPSPKQPKPQVSTEPLTAQALVDGLLQHIYKVTEPLRLRSAASNAAACAGTTNAILAPLPALPVGCPSLPTQAPKPSLPGKLDHATLVAYTVGSHS